MWIYNVKKHDRSLSPVMIKTSQYKRSSCLSTLPVVHRVVSHFLGDFFASSCVPGAKSREYDIHGNNPESLCQNCIGKGVNFCARNSYEPYFSHSGSFRLAKIRRNSMNRYQLIKVLWVHSK